MNATKILIVDDEPLTCQLIAKVLALHGFEAASLTDEKKIVPTIETTQPDLILLDYHLGAKSGLDVLENLRQSAGGEKIPVIFTSGIDRRRQVMEAGAQGFLQKPFDWNELVSLINSLTPNHDLQGEPWTSVQN